MKPKPQNNPGNPRRNPQNRSRNQNIRPNNANGPVYNMRTPPHVEELRELMHEQGVLVVSYITDTNSRMLLQGIHLESRGLMLPQDGKSLHTEIVSKSREFYEVALQDIPDIEIKDLNRLLKQDLEKLFKNILGRVPCIIVLIHTL